MSIRAVRDGLELVLHDAADVRLRAGDHDDAAAAAHDGDRAQVVALDAAGRAIGRVAYARVYGPRAVLTIDVDDAYWHRGLPEALLAELCSHACNLGISSFLAHVARADLRLLALLRANFAARERTPDGRYVEVEFATAPAPAASTSPARDLGR